MGWGVGLRRSLSSGTALKSSPVHVVCGGFLGGSVVKNLPANARDTGLVPGLGRSLGEGNGNSVLYSCLGNPMDKGNWCAIVHGVTKSWI